MIEVFPGRGGDPQFYFRVRGANGEIQAQSEGYTRPEDAERGARALVENVKAIPDVTAAIKVVDR